VNLPFDKPENPFSVRFSGRFVTVQTRFGLEVYYDGDHYISVGLDRSFRKKVEGKQRELKSILLFFFS